jgi:hypothetical protein
MSYNFRAGRAELEDAATRKSSGSFSFVPRIRWREDAETKYILVLTSIEEVIRVQLHEWIPVGKGERADGETYTRWEDFISRKDPAIGEDYDELSERLERDAKDRFVGIAVELEPEVETGNNNRKRVTGFTVKTKDYTKKGENDGDDDVEMTQPELGLIIESQKTFWGPMGSIDSSQGPLSELPLEVIRRGKDQHTRYDSIPFMDVPVDLSPIIDHLDGISYLNDEMDDVVNKIEAADGDMLAAAQVVADVMLSKRLNELADGQRYEELVSPLKLEDMPKPFGKKKPAAKKKDRPARATRRQAKEPDATAEVSDTPEAPAEAESKDDHFAALKARVGAEGR